MTSRKVLVVVLTNNVAVNMDKSKNCMPRGSKTMNSNQLLCGRGIPCKDEGFEREHSLTLVLLTILYFISFMHEMHEDMLCIHRILRIIHLQ